MRAEKESGQDSKNHELVLRGCIVDLNHAMTVEPINWRTLSRDDAQASATRPPPHT